MFHPEASVITHYFEANALRDIDAMVALFSNEAVVVDEARTYHSLKEIRGWREGVASVYQYTTQIDEIRHINEKNYLVTGRLTGNFPGGTAELQWRFTLSHDLISRLEIE